MQGLMALARGDAGGAVEFLEKALQIARALGLKWGPTLTGYIDDSLRDLSVARLQMGDLRASAALAEEALALSGETGNMNSAAHSKLCLGYALLAQGKVERARMLLRASLRHFRDVGSVHSMLINTAALAEASHVLGDIQASAVLAGAAAAHRAGLSATAIRMGPLLPICERMITEAHSRLNSPELAAAWAEGQAMTLEQAVAYALAD